MNLLLVLGNILFSRRETTEIDLEALSKSSPRGDSLASGSEKRGSKEGTNESKRAKEVTRRGAEENEELPGDDDGEEDEVTFMSRIRGRLHLVKNYILERDDRDSEDSLHDAIYRWLPIFSGIVIPFSILLEIPGLTEHWYILTENNVIAESKKNSALLDAGMSISMASALIANIALIFRFLERKVRTNTLIAIITLTIHGALLATPT